MGLRKAEISAEEILLQEHDCPRQWNVLWPEEVETAGRGLTFRHYQEVSLYSAGQLLDIEQKRTWKEVVMVYSNIMYWHFPED
jgi:hypothetical protein